MPAEREKNEGTETLEGEVNIPMHLSNFSLTTIFSSEVILYVELLSKKVVSVKNCKYFEIGITIRVIAFKMFTFIFLKLFDSLLPSLMEN